MQRKIIFVLMVFFLSFYVFCESEGEKLFKQNKPSEAVLVLEQEIRSGQVSQDTFNFLALAYFQLGNYEKSIETFERGMLSPLSNRKQLCFNEGNVAFVKGDYERAENCFSLALAASPQMYTALLNRANTRLKMKKYSESSDDYKKFIEACPEDEQREKIEKLISYLDEQIAMDAQEKVRREEEKRTLEEENRRLQEELARQKAENDAKAAEKQALDEERRRKLLEDVANSLLQTDTTNMSAGAESVLNYDNDSELD